VNGGGETDVEETKEDTREREKEKEMYQQKQREDTKAAAARQQLNCHSGNLFRLKATHPTSNTAGFFFENFLDGLHYSILCALLIDFRFW
jgi:hypothetical protein